MKHRPKVIYMAECCKCGNKQIEQQEVLSDRKCPLCGEWGFITKKIVVDGK